MTCQSPSAVPLKSLNTQTIRLVCIDTSTFCTSTRSGRLKDLCCSTFTTYGSASSASFEVNTLLKIKPLFCSWLILWLLWIRTFMSKVVQQLYELMSWTKTPVTSKIFNLKKPKRTTTTWKRKRGRESIKEVWVEIVKNNKKKTINCKIINK